MVIAVDFDGTCVTHDYPLIGKDIGAIPVLKELVANGHKLIIYTMRGDSALLEAVEWYKENGIEFWGVNKNKAQFTWTTSPKIYAQMYIDDASLGCPLRYDMGLSTRPFVDWAEVREMLVQKGLIK